MGRSIAGVIVGYIVMFVVVFGGLSGAYLGMGADKAFKPGTYDISTLWMGVWFGVSLLAAVAGGAVCSMISKGGKAPMVLAGLVLALGLGMSTLALMAEKKPDEPRISGTSNLEAMKNAKEPMWVMLANPVIGAVGVVIGAGLRKKKA